MVNRKFKRNKLYVTDLVQNKIKSNEGFRLEITAALDRYANCDWGDMCDYDKSLNNEAVKSFDDERILAEYNTILGKIYIITEADNSATTILFAEEY